MKKTIHININSIEFSIDEDAYIVLEKYLDDIKKFYSSSEERKEILEDIESRIAEVFFEKINSSKKVININDVNDLIATMGTPADFSENNINEENEKCETPRRFYRDTDNKILGGVCSGIATYFNIDSVWVRVIFIFFILVGFSIPFLFYVLLWIIIPEAKTLAQKYEMRGRPINLNNIEQNVKDEINDVKTRFKNGKGKEKAEKFIEIFGTIISFTAKLIVTFIGIIITFVGLILIFAILISFFTSVGFLSFFTDAFVVSESSSIIYYFFDNKDGLLLTTSLLLIIGLPVLGIIFSGVKLIFGINKRHKGFAGFAFFLWIVSLIIFIVMIINKTGNFSKSYNSKNEVVINNIKDTLYLKNIEFNYEGNEIMVIKDEFLIAKNNDSLATYIKPKIKIIRTNDKNISIIINKSSKGETREKAEKLTNQIKYNFNQTDSVIYFDKYFSLGEANKWRNQDLRINIKIPNNIVVIKNDEFIKFED